MDRDLLIMLTEANTRANYEAQQHASWRKLAELSNARADREAAARQEAERRALDLRNLWDYWTARAVASEAERDRLRAELAALRGIVSAWQASRRHTVDRVGEVGRRTQVAHGADNPHEASLLAYVPRETP